MTLLLQMYKRPNQYGYILTACNNRSITLLEQEEPGSIMRYGIVHKLANMLFAQLPFMWELILIC